MRDELEQLKKQALTELEQIKQPEQLKDFEINYLGRKGKLTSVLKQLKDVPKIDRPAMGSLANETKQGIIQSLELKKTQLVQGPKLAMSAIEATWPGRDFGLGHLHPITQFLNKVQDIFMSMGFEVVEGPEVETQKFNFDLLNIPKNHPARDAWDTFYVEGGLLMRTHTSPVQLRAMKKSKPPVRLIAPGRVFRNEATDAGHETNFYQCEGLVIDKCITVANLISTLESFLKQVFGQNVKIRVRPEYYPFVEPGLDVDMQCLICGGSGCSVCKQRGWLEMLGSGMVHPTVLKNMGVDPAKYSGFAFGLGIDRLMMLYHSINDIRFSYSGDSRFLEQF
ncbi:phenylalanine--tRNA ligase subunit alpha [Patescibacteria group bacterium]|nr:phenylalanine--tRNA ligase subunit alpha [Patescibacteria group bacterium]MBU0964076.1 phenylalanine--tRNA ligase subunit alpha [Patescibacteria group bacterium]